MPPEPVTKRTAAFVDGQNLFWQAKYAFGYAYPNYDPLLLAHLHLSGGAHQLNDSDVDGAHGIGVVIEDADALECVLLLDVDFLADLAP